MTITPEEIAEWRKVCEEATEGVAVKNRKNDYYYSPYGICRTADELSQVAECMSIEDATFFVTDRTAILRLLDELDTLEYWKSTANKMNVDMHSYVAELAAKDALIAKYRESMYQARDEIEKYGLHNRALEILQTALQAREES